MSQPSSQGSRPATQTQSQNSSSSSQPFQTDARFRAALPTASLKSSVTVPQVDSETFLQNHEEEWNRLVDVEIEALAEGMADLVGIASVCTLAQISTCTNVLGRLKTRIGFKSHKRRFRQSVGQRVWCVRYVFAVLINPRARPLQPIRY